MNLSVYRLTDLSQLTPFKQEMGEEKYFKYAISVYKQLARLESGARFNIKKYVKEKNLDLFVKIVCMYINDYPGQVLFTDDFSEVKRCI